MKRKIALLMAGCMLMGTGFGAVSVNAEEVKKVKVMTITPSNEMEYALLDSQVELFAEMYPGYELEFSYGTMSIEDGSLVTLLNSGQELPDVINTHSGVSRIGALAKAGLIQDMSALYEEHGWKDMLNPAAMDLCSLIDGKLYEVPKTMDSIGCYYNKEIFEELNVEIPQTWDEFINICELAKEAGYEPLALGARDGYSVGWSFGNILQAVAGTEEARKLLFSETKWTDEAGLKALTTFEEFVKNEYFSNVSSTRNEADAIYAFLNKKTAMYLVGAWCIVDIYSNDMQDVIGSFPLPSQVGDTPCATSGLGTSYCIPSGIEDTDGAEHWFDFILSEEYAQLLAADETNDSIYPTRAFSEAEVASPLLQAAREAVTDAAGRNPSVFVGTETKNAYFQNLQGIVAGILTGEEAAENIQAAQETDLAAAE